MVKNFIKDWIMTGKIILPEQTLLKILKIKKNMKAILK